MKQKYLLRLSLGAIVAGGLTVMALQQRQPRRHVSFIAKRFSVKKIHRRQIHIETARSFNLSSSMLAWSVLADSAIEHYRGGFSNPAMALPLVSSLSSLFAGMHGSQDRRPRRHIIRHAIYRVAAGVGIAGTAFHCYNISHRAGGWCWNNLFYAAPLGAPMALFLSGALGDVAERLRDEPASAPRLLGMPAGKALALVSSAGLMGTVAEVALLHFRGAFQHRAMYAPLILPPTAAALLTHAAFAKSPSWPARWALRLTTWLGGIGMLFHIRGVARCHGGWRNWRQNLLSGPPVPAPPGFTALALAGLAALKLRETES